jgi:hypothetical protein
MKESSIAIPASVINDAASYDEGVKQPAEDDTAPAAEQSLAPQPEPARTQQQQQQQQQPSLQQEPAATTGNDTGVAPPAEPAPTERNEVEVPPVAPPIKRPESARPEPAPAHSDGDMESSLRQRFESNPPQPAPPSASSAENSEGAQAQ